VVLNLALDFDYPVVGYMPHMCNQVTVSC